MSIDFQPLSSSPPAAAPLQAPPSLLRQFFSKPLALFGLTLLSALLLLSLLYPLFTSFSYDQTSLSSANAAPSLLHPFGTDDLGRDLLTRTCYGMRISLFVAICAALIDMTIGVMWGGIAAMRPGLIGNSMMRLVDLVAALPNMLLVILVIVVFSPSIFTVIVALSITGWLNMARIVRGQVLKVKEEPYIHAAQCLGASPQWILLHHILPSIQGTILVAVTLTIPSAIFTEAFLSFVGLGIQAPQASLGVLASEGLGAMHYYPWRIAFPALMLCLLNVSFHCLGRVAADLLNPKLQAKLEVRP